MAVAGKNIDGQPSVIFRRRSTVHVMTTGLQFRVKHHVCPDIAYSLVAQTPTQCVGNDLVTFERMGS